MLSISIIKLRYRLVFFALQINVWYKASLISYLINLKENTEIQSELWMENLTTWYPIDRKETLQIKVRILSG